MWGRRGWLTILLYACVGRGWLGRWTPPPPVSDCCGIKISDCLSVCLLQKPEVVDGRMDGRVDIWIYERMDDRWIHTYDLCIMRVKLSHTRVLIHTTHRWAQSDWQLLLRTILTCMFGSNYTPGTLWHCEVTSWSSLIWWGEQSMLSSSLWCKEYFCIDYVGVCYESVYAVAHITAPPPILYHY